MKVYKNMRVPPQVVDWAKTHQVPKIQNAFSWVDTVRNAPFGLTNILYCSCVSPHVDPEFPKWGLLWVIRNDDLIISDTEESEYAPRVGSLFALNIHSPHSCMPKFHDGVMPSHDRLFMAINFECRVCPSETTARRKINQAISVIRNHLGVIKWT